MQCALVLCNNMLHICWRAVVFIISFNIFVESQIDESIIIVSINDFLIIQERSSNHPKFCSNYYIHKISNEDKKVSYFQFCDWKCFLIFSVVVQYIEHESAQQHHTKIKKTIFHLRVKKKKSNCEKVSNKK